MRDADTRVAGPAREIHAEPQPDPFHFKRAFQKKRILLTQDRDYLDDDLFPLSQTRGVCVFDIDAAKEAEIARALKVVDTLGVTAPTGNEQNVVIHSHYTMTAIRRVWDEKPSPNFR